MADTILVVNAGSSSIKFQLFSVGERDRLQRLLKGQIEGIGVRPRLFAKGVKGETLIDQTWPGADVRRCACGARQGRGIPARRRSEACRSLSAIVWCMAALTTASRSSSTTP